MPDIGIDSAVDAGVDANIRCIEIPEDGSPVRAELETPIVVGRADVVFAVDVSPSMSQEIDQVQRNLRDRLVPGIRQAIPDSQFAVVSFADFPVLPCGSGNGLPFRLLLPVTEELGRVQSGVDSLRVGDGGRDSPEAQVEALYQIATGEGLAPYVPANFGCPRGGFGYPCFRNDALPVVLLFTDAAFHGGQGNSNPYTCRLEARPHSYEQTVERLNAGGIRVLGLFSGPNPDDGLWDMQGIARDTQATDNGRPLVFDIGTRGERLSESVIDAIQTLIGVSEFDIDALALDGNPADNIDPTQFIEAIVPISANPMSGIGSIDRAAGIFRRVRTGTSVVFELRLRNGMVAPGQGPQRFLVDLVFRGDGRTRLGSKIIELVIPGADGNGC